MKKVKSIGKKVMSVGLAVSLLLVPVKANNCCFAMQANPVQEENLLKGTLKKIGLTGVGVAGIYGIFCVLGVIGAISDNRWCSNMGEYGCSTIEDLCSLIKQVFSSLGDILTDAYNTLETIGFKNVFSAVGAWYVTKKLWNGTKWAYNKVTGWFSSKPKEENSNKGSNVTVNHYYNYGPKAFDNNSRLNDDE